MNDANEKTLLFVSGDFSGIQDTVYTISSKGALKSLRARSFMLELLTEHIVYEILQIAGIDMHSPENYHIKMMPASDSIQTGVIYSGGGAFALILQNTESIKAGIADFTDILNQWAFFELSGKLFIAVSSLEVSETGIKNNFQKLRKAQSEKLEEIKKRRFWQKHGTLLNIMLTPQMPVQMTNESECQITRRDDLPDIREDWPNNRMTAEIDKDFTVSALSSHLWRLGNKLTDLKPGSEIFRYAYEPADAKTGKGCLFFPTRCESEYALYALDSQENRICEKKWTIGEDFYYAYYVQKTEELSDYAQAEELLAARENQPLITLEQMRGFERTASFTGLAACSCGADMIGALRMDVDDLGKIFGEIADYRELAEISDHLNTFFKVILNQICEGAFDKISPYLCEADKPSDELQTAIFETSVQKKRHVSIIYAGGDDLFIVGAWNEIIELAFDIKTCFQRYCEALNIQNLENDQFGSISGGVTLHHPKFPLYQMAKRSGEAELEAKNDNSFSQIKKNRLALFFDPQKKQRKLSLKEQNRYMLSMSWDSGMTCLLPLMRSFTGLGERDIIKKGRKKGREIFIMRGFAYQTVEKLFLTTMKFHESGRLYLATMARVLYDIHRNLNPDAFSRLLKYLYNPQTSDIANLHTALIWLSYLRRER